MEIIMDYSLRELVCRGFVVALQKLIFTFSLIALGLYVTVYNQLWCTVFCASFSILIFIVKNVIISEDKDSSDTVLFLFNVSLRVCVCVCVCV